MNEPLSDAARAALGPAAPTPIKNREPAWLVQAREIVSDLHQRSPLVYWVDFLLSISGAWLVTLIYFIAPHWSALQYVSLVVASLLFFRAGTFIHEIIHMPPGQMVWFGRAWNLLQGIPLLMPWVMYRNHVDHHSAQHFGSPEDGEYLPLAASPLRETIKYLAQAPLLPLLTFMRFGILGPLSWLQPGLREWVLTRASAAITNPYYRKRFPKRDESHLKLVEGLCFAYLIGLALLLYGQVVTGPHLLMAYVLLAFALTLNLIRNLAAHRYDNRGDLMSHADQIGDAINITGQNWLTVLMFPVGLRYHALHHLFPTLPYHNLGKAHRRLSTQLPPEAPYHASGRESFLNAAADLLESALRTPPEKSAMARWRNSSKAR